MARSKPVKKQRRNPKRKRRDEGERPPETIGSFFLDSGAHSLFNIYAHNVGQHERYAFYETDDFWQYVDDYCEFVKANIHAIDYYANVDVIHNPKLSWKVLKYIEKDHGLNPVPVVHMGTEVKWLRRHLDAGYDYIGLGGVALEGTRTSYLHWADQMFECICDTPDRTPKVKVHGFAMTAYASLVRYPWYSVDSTSWAKAGGFGMVYFPKKINGEFVFVPPDPNDWSRVKAYEPYNLSCSANAPAAKKKGQSYLSVSSGAQKVLAEWLESIDVPIGTVDEDCEMLEWGVVSHHAARKIANLRFFEHLTAALPDWPWRFKATSVKGFGLI